MFGSGCGSRDYRAAAWVASAALFGGCASAESDSPSTLEGPDLLDAAALEALLPLTLAPSAALLAAWAWEADEAAACPSRETEGDVLTLRGGCTTAAGEALTGSVARDRAPNGGTWVFDDLGVEVAGRRTTWSGNVGWIQTDGANNLTAYDFTGVLAGAGSLGWTSLGGRLDDAGRLITAAGPGSLRLDRAADGSIPSGEAVPPLALTVAGAWGYADCAENPVEGEVTWSTDQHVTASFVATSCGGCVPWTGSDGARGEWCGE